MGLVQLLAWGILPAAHQPAHLLGRQQPEPVQEVRHGVRVGAEGGLVLHVLVLFAILGSVHFLGLVRPGGLNARRCGGRVQLRGRLRPWREQRLEVALVQRFLEDHGCGSVQRRFAGLGADAGPVRLRVHVLRIAGRHRHPRSDGFPDQLEVPGRLVVALVDLPHGFAGQLAIRLGDRQPRLGEGPGFGRGDLLEPVQDLQHRHGIGAVHPDVVAGEVVSGLRLEVRSHVLRLVLEISLLEVIVQLVLTEFGAVVDERVLLRLMRRFTLVAPIASPEHRFLRRSACPRVGNGRTAEPRRRDEGGIGGAERSRAWRLPGSEARPAFVRQQLHVERVGCMRPPDSSCVRHRELRGSGDAPHGSGGGAPRAQ